MQEIDDDVIRYLLGVGDTCRSGLPTAPIMIGDNQMPVRGWKRHIDYFTFAEYQQQWIGNAALSEWLPDTGFVACDAAGLAAFAFIHCDPSSALAHLVFLTNRTGDSERVASDAIAAVTNTCALCAKHAGYALLATASPNRGVIELNEKMGWIRTPGAIERLVLDLGAI